MQSDKESLLQQIHRPRVTGWRNISGTGIAGDHHMNLFSWQKYCTFDRNAQCNARYSQFISTAPAQR